MKSNCFKYLNIPFARLCYLLLVLCAGFDLQAQQDADAKQKFEQVKARAETGEARAQYELSCMYFQGSGVRQDYKKTVSWLRKAAEQGLPEAEDALALRYHFGQGVNRDESEAVKWFRKAAEQGFLDAERRLGLCFENGEGVPKDLNEAIKWFRKAAEQHDAFGQRMLGIAYGEGKSVSQNYAESASWLKKAATQGDAVAQFELGMLYVKGNGVPKDYVEAYKWWNLSAAQAKAEEGSETAKGNLIKVESIMTPEQIAEGQRLAAAFVPRKETAGSSSDKSALSDNPTFTGTGFLITDDGFLISSYHIVKDATKVRLLTSLGLISAKVVKVDAANDLALLKAEGKFSPLPVASSQSVKLGATVATVGFPNIGLQGFAPKLAKGEIASLTGAADDPQYFQISVAVQPGNSGGALVDVRGNVVGIVSAKLNAAAALQTSGALPENVNYAVKSSFLLSFLESVPDVAAKLKEQNAKEQKFEDVVKSAEQAAVLVLVY